MIHPRPEILATPAAYHGAFDYAELEQLGLNPNAVLDFSVNSNPYGPPACVRDVLATVPLDRYPDRDCLALRRALVDAHPLFTSMDNVVVGNGTAELLMLMAQAFVHTGDTVLIIGPTFGEYARAARLMGARVEMLTASAETGFEFDHAAIAAALESYQPRVVFFCTPNNPTGTAPGLAMADLAERFPNSLFVSDEAYINFVVSERSSYTLETRLHPNVILLRSLTKDFALAGLRLGYAVGQPDVIAAVAAVRPAWNVNALAQAAGLAVLSPDGGKFLHDSVQRLRDAKEALTGELTALGLRVLPSLVHYFLVQVGDAPAFRSTLLKHHLMVRDCTSFGLPDHVRIATRTPEDNQRLLDALQKVL